MSYLHPTCNNKCFFALLPICNLNLASLATQSNDWFLNFTKRMNSCFLFASDNQIFTWFWVGLELATDLTWTGLQLPQSSWLILMLPCLVASSINAQCSKQLVGLQLTRNIMQGFTYHLFTTSVKLQLNNIQEFGYKENDASFIWMLD